MSNTDFIDDDLIRRRDSVNPVKFGPAAEPASEPDAVPMGSVVPSHSLNLTPLAQKHIEINNQLVDSSGELERLRARQIALEKERSALEQLRQNQEKYETGKRELVEKLEQNLVYLEREEVRLNQHLALLTESDAAFSEMLEMVRGLDESKWPEDSEGFRDELHRSLVMVENARREFNKSVARIEALHSEKGASMPVNIMPPPTSASAVKARSFGEWMLLGLAVSLPMIVVVAVATALIYFRVGY